ncbi:acyl-CoA dehydrogenase, N-terminal domain protein [Mycobacterium xenopi 3993]|nr:acyl-CoA dehydrogenase, N-terminal domain protein [Mycobacterium xenopi 3993]
MSGGYCDRMVRYRPDHARCHPAVHQEEIVPNLAKLESGEMPPYPILRKLFSEFGIDVMAAEAVKNLLDRERAKEAEIDACEPEARQKRQVIAVTHGMAAQASMIAILLSELAGTSLGLVAAAGVSLGLGAATILSRGSLAQKERWLPDLMTFNKIAAWAITEPDSGSDAFGGMKTYVKRDGDDYILNGQKTFITNGPYADVLA